MKVTKALATKAAKELNDLIFDEGEGINIKATVAEIKEELIEAGGLLKFTDLGEISQGTLDLLSEGLAVELPEEQKKGKKAKEEEAEEEAEEEVEEKPAKKGKKEKAAKKGKKGKKAKEEAEEEVEEEAEEEAEEEVEEKPAKKGKKAKEEAPAPEKEEKAGKKEKKGKKDKAAKKEKKKRVNKSALVVDHLTPLIKKGKSTKSDLIESAMEAVEGLSESTVKTIISDGKNPKYSKFEKLLTISEKGKVSFKK